MVDPNWFEQRGWIQFVASGTGQAMHGDGNDQYKNLSLGSKQASRRGASRHEKTKHLFRHNRRRSGEKSIFLISRKGTNRRRRNARIVITPLAQVARSPSLGGG
ncbi:MAG TPA: hypothetical protein VJW76_16990, partial [Verrucomicrobiae bacterium]|nr:hypothetical protein [Verrucomicrobiae bacterium]